MADATVLIARVLRVALVLAVAAMAAGVLLDPVLGVPQPWSPLHTVGELCRGAGIATVIAAPFVVLVVLAGVGHRSRVGWYAAGTLMLALAGILLAR